MTEVATQPDVLGSLGINGKLFISQLINVGIILFVAWRWVYRPLLKVMDSRAQKIAEGLTNAVHAKKRMAEATEQTEKMLAEARLHVQEMLKQAQVTAEQKRQEVLKETQADLERQLQDARGRLKQEKEVMMGAAKSEIVNLIAAVTSKVVQETMEEKGQKGSIERALEALDRTV